MTMGWLIFDTFVFAAGYVAAVYSWEWVRPILVGVKNMFPKPPG